MYHSFCPQVVGVCSQASAWVVVYTPSIPYPLYHPSIPPFYATQPFIPHALPLLLMTDTHCGIRYWQLFKVDTATMAIMMQEMVRSLLHAGNETNCQGLEKSKPDFLRISHSRNSNNTNYRNSETGANGSRKRVPRC